MAFLCSAFMIGKVESFSALIPAYPHIQAKAHEELNRVVRHDRLPTVEDGKDPPYISTIIKQLSMVITHYWLMYTMCHDPQRYPEPFSFNPDCYLTDHTLSSESANLPNAMERNHWTFGVGRRICPGILVAEREVFLAISQMLWAFKMEQLQGEPINLKEYDGLSGHSPVLFRIKMIPRHDKVTEVLNL
ncbi:Cytochrome P450 2F3 [Leucoagaricus sp. SymC.cos]|nr:Cytochrome P450 2F3 [Leucoagaricus sp. SymC.cos]